MAIREIVTVGSPGDKVLHRQATRVREFGPELGQLLDDMVETMHDALGVGLAAPQIGLGKRITVVEYPEDEENAEETLKLYELINPEIIREKGSEVAQEGCLSLPGLTADVERATYVLVRAQDRNGKEFRVKAYGWLARILQHEIDHLLGVMMTDRAEQIYRLCKSEDGEYEAVPVDDPTISSVR